MNPSAAKGQTGRQSVRRSYGVKSAVLRLIIVGVSRCEASKRENESSHSSSDKVG